MYYSEKYPEYKMVVISDNSRFDGNNHVVNYMVNDDKTLHVISYIKISDSYKVIEYSIGGWEYDDNLGNFKVDYYHFYMDNEIPTRTYMDMKPNAEYFYETILAVV